MSRSPEHRDTDRWALQSMGITVWERRDGDVEPPPLESMTEAALEPMPVHEPEPAPIAEAPPVAPPATPATDQGEVADMDWDALHGAVMSCTRCPLHQGRSQGVFGVGARDARWMIIGEAPGAEEDRRGEPFVGRAGKLLDSMLEAVGLDRSTVFIANILKSRPPDNRDPHADEIAACTPYLERQIALVRPSIIVAVGRIAAQHLLATEDAVGRLRGSVHAYGRDSIPLVVTYHPAYLLRQPSAKAKSWQDLKLARRTAEAGLR